jgi:creatinine amidohydrolase
MRYEFAKPEDYRAARAAAPIAYLAWGAHEWHGLHNPLGLDALKAHGVCLALCEKTGGVVFPPIYCGHQTMKPYAGFEATLDYTKACVQLLATETLNQLADEGFKVVVLVMGHYGGLHVAALQEVVADFNESQDQTVAWAFPDYEPLKSEGIAGDHAGQTETSYMMLFHPGSVELDRLPREGELDMKKDGVGGVDPRGGNASAEFGANAVAALVRNAAPRILELLADKT